MKINRSLSLLVVLGATAASSAAWADAPRYDFLDLGYQGVNEPASSHLSSAHTYFLDGSYAFTDQLIGSAEYAHENADFHLLGLNGSDSGNTYSLGLGYRFPLSGSVDLVPNLSYISQHDSANAAGSIGSVSSSTSDTGYDLGVLLRAMVTDKLELDANVDHTTPGSAANSVGVAALYDFTSAFAVGLGYASESSNGQNINGWTLALRYYFK